MSLDYLLGLILFVSAAALSPGGATTLATASGMQFGLRASIPLIAGISVGMAALGGAAGAGLGGVVAAAPGLRLSLSIVGTAYLLWLAFKVATAGRPTHRSHATPTKFLGGLTLLMANPKAWAVTLSAAAAFSGVGLESAFFAGLLALAFGTASIISMSIWCVAGTMIAQFLRSDFQWRVVNIALGISLGVAVIPLWTGGSGT